MTGLYRRLSIFVIAVVLVVPAASYAATPPDHSSTPPFSAGAPASISAPSFAAYASAATLRSKGIRSSNWLAPAKPGQIVVVFKSALDVRQRVGFQSAVSGSGGSIQRWDVAGLTAVVDVPADQSRPAYASALASDSAVAWIQPRYLYHATWTPNDPLYSSQWGFAAIGAPAAWDIERGSAAVKVAVIDTGVDLFHPDLVGQLDTANGWDFVNHDSVAQDDDGHGTHVAGIVAAASDNGLFVAGTAPECRILPIKVLDSTGSGATEDVSSGIMWAADHGAKVINLSLGSTFNDALLQSACAYALAKDVVICAAVGNDGSSTGAFYPAAYPGVIGVGAVDSGLHRASFSNYGPGVDLVAPGSSILSTLWTSSGSTTGIMSGTSMATPYVTGVAALVRSRYSWASAATVEEQLEWRARDLGTIGWDGEYGWGLVQADAAVNGAAPDEHDIPGTGISSSPVTGTLVPSDTSDVYRVRLEAGQGLHLSLTGDASTDFSVNIFDPTATSVSATLPIAGDASGAYPRTTDATVPVAGDYYIQIERLSGSGAYTLSWSITNPPPGPDDEIPGVVLPPSPVAGSLDRVTDQRDVYRVHLMPGDALNVSVAGVAGTDFDLYLFPPGTANVATGRSVASAKLASYPDRLAYGSPVEGDYYLDVRAFSGAGPYALTWSVTHDTNAEIPGAALPASPVYDSLSSVTDERDVFSLDLQAGQLLDLSLTGGAANDYDLRLFGPSATSVRTDSPLASALTKTYPETIRSLVVPATGAYYVEVRRVSGSGGYSLGWSVTPVPDHAALERVQGAVRYDVSSNLARRGWDPTGDRSWPGVTRLIVASGEDKAAADPLSAAGLAGLYGVPILLVKSDPKAALPPATAAIIAEVAAAHPGVQIHIVGGPASVPDKTWERIRAIRGVSSVKDRLSGRDRYEVTAAIANRMIDVRGTAGIPGVLIVSAENPAAFYDALAVSPAAYVKQMPMLGVRGNSVPASVSAVLARLAGKPRYVVNSSVYISPVVASATGASSRIAGSANRYVAAHQIAEFSLAQGWLHSRDTALAAKLPDALCGGAFLGKRGGVMLFTDSTARLQPDVIGYMNGHRADVWNAWILGGPVSVTSPAETQYRGLLR